MLWSFFRWAMSDLWDGQSRLHSADTYVRGNRKSKGLFTFKCTDIDGRSNYKSVAVFNRKKEETNGCGFVIIPSWFANCSGVVVARRG